MKNLFSVHQIHKSYSLGVVTHKGNVRKTNQDHCLALTDLKERPGSFILAVADGMGGLQDGEYASRLIVERLKVWWNDSEGLRENKLEAELKNNVRSLIYTVHRELYYFGETEKVRTGTTLSLIVAINNHYSLWQIGDSRIYFIKSGNLYQMTRDQTYENYLIDQGKIPAKKAFSEKNQALTNALGVSQELEIVEREGELDDISAVLVCTDGFYHSADLGVAAIYAENADPQIILDSMLKDALCGPAKDNITAIMIRLR